MNSNQRIVLARRPVGWADESCFALEPCAEPACGPEDVLLEAIYLSTDPYLRGRMNAGPSDAPGFEIGQPIVSRVAARVLRSGHAGYRPGEIVWGFLDWALRSVARRGEGLHLFYSLPVSRRMPNSQLLRRPPAPRHCRRRLRAPAQTTRRFARAHGGGVGVPPTGPTAGWPTE